MLATYYRLVGLCEAEKGYARIRGQWHVQVEPECPFRMQEADRRVDYDVAGEEHFFPAGTDMHRDMPWRVTGGVEGGHARRHPPSGLGYGQAGAGQFRIPPRNRRRRLCVSF